MKRMLVFVVLALFAAPCAFAAAPVQAVAEKAKAEGKVTFYANITAV